MSEIMVRERFLRSGKKVYEYSFEMASVDGKRKRKSKSGFASKRDARIAGRKALSEYENVGQVMVDRDISYADFGDLWMENDCKLTCKESTLYGYEKKTSSLEIEGRSMDMEMHEIYSEQIAQQVIPKAYIPLQGEVTFEDVKNGYERYFKNPNKGTIVEYANLLELSEKDAKKEIEEDFNESIQKQFDDSDNITDKGIADYTEKLTEVKKLAKYKVQDVKEEDGVYTVSVQVEPSNVFQTLQQSSTEVSNEKIKQGLDGNDPEVFAAVLTESVQKSLEKNSYGKTVTVKVSVEKDNSGKYGLSDTEMNKLEAAMFPTE